MKLKKIPACVYHIFRTKMTMLLQSSRVPNKKILFLAVFYMTIDYYMFILFTLKNRYIYLHESASGHYVLLKSLHYVPMARRS